MVKKIIYMIIFAVFIGAPMFMFGADLNHQYPKLANLFFRWDISDAEARDLAKWDILIIDMDVQTYTPQSLVKIKQYNPNIKLLAYLAPEEVRGDSSTLNGTLRQKLYNQIDSSWWLRNSSGGQVAWWAPNPMFNVTDQAPRVNGASFADMLANFVKTNLMNTGYWDGVLYDNVWDDVGFMASYNIDLNRDGAPEPMAEVNSKWRDGMRNLLATTRNVLGPNAIIMGNGNDYYYEYLNGTLFEHFPYKGWGETMKRYRAIVNNGYAPGVGILNTNVGNTGRRDDYAKMRFGLASALMENGYNSFDGGDQSHNEIWWYDEYEASLGKPLGQAKNILGDSANYTASVWRRDFQNGLALVNATGKRYDVDLGGEYEKIHGTQDKLVNDGSFVSRVSLAPNDGMILIRPIEKIVNAPYINGSFARVYNKYGHMARSGFFAYDDKFRGSSQVEETDINKDGVNEFIVANMSQVSIYNAGGIRIANFYPYTEAYKQGINIAVGDLNGDGYKEIVTGTDKGGGPHVRVFGYDGRLINAGFFAYTKNFRGGVNVGVGDVDGNGTNEIITGAGFGGGPHVKIFTPGGVAYDSGFFAYATTFRGGVNIAVGDINGDGKSEIITGSGTGGAPQVRMFTGKGASAGPDFYAFDKNARIGVKVVVTDMEGDGEMEIITTTSDVFTLAGFSE